MQVEKQEYKWKTNLSNDLKNWTLLRMYPQIPLSMGGWESWMQIDFPAYLLSQSPHIDVVREQKYGMDQQRVDWKFNGSFNVTKQAAVEIKVQSKQTLQDTQFKQQVVNDLVKLDRYRERYECNTIMIVGIVYQESLLTIGPILGNERKKVICKCNDGQTPVWFVMSSSIGEWK